MTVRRRVIRVGKEKEKEKEEEEGPEKTLSKMEATQKEEKKEIY